MAVKIKQFLKLQTALINEKVRIEARLIEIARVLEGDMPPVAPAPTLKQGRRKFSEATKAKMRIAQQARWAKIKGKAGQAATGAQKNNER